MSRKDRARHILKRLKQEFPDVSVALNHSTAFELLVATILSAQCTDERVNQVTAKMFPKYESVRDFAELTRKQLTEDISSISLKNNKAKYIIASAQMIIDEYGGEVPNELDKLMKLPGVGKKTANVVLGEWYGIPAGFTVDTHVKRCAYRMGLTDSKNVNVIEKDLMSVFPKPEWIDTATRIILHGRTTCPANRKESEPCSLGDLCQIRS